MSAAAIALAALAGLALCVAPLPHPRVTKLVGAACAVAAVVYLVIDLFGERLLWVAAPLGAFALVASAMHLHSRFPSAQDTLRLQAECHALSRALLQFLADREFADADPRSHWHELHRDATAGDRERAFQARVEQILEHRRQTIAIYRRDFRAYALRLAGDARVSRRDRRCCEQPATPGGIREVAQILGYIALGRPSAPSRIAPASEHAARPLALVSQTL
jgi:hypothetical protein